MSKKALLCWKCEIKKMQTTFINRRTQWCNDNIHIKIIDLKEHPVNLPTALLDHIEPFSKCPYCQALSISLQIDYARDPLENLSQDGGESRFENYVYDFWFPSLTLSFCLKGIQFWQSPSFSRSCHFISYQLVKRRRHLHPYGPHSFLSVYRSAEQWLCGNSIIPFSLVSL